MDDKFATSNLYEKAKRRAYFIWKETGNTDEKANFYQALKEEFANMSSSDYECVICHQTIISNHSYSVLECGHFFCSPCLKAWIENKYLFTCPICRKWYRVYDYIDKTKTTNTTKSRGDNFVFDRHIGGWRYYRIAS